MNVFAKFDEILSMILQDIKETKCYGQTAKFDEILSMILQDIKETKCYGQTVGPLDVPTDVKN